MKEFIIPRGVRSYYFVFDKYRSSARIIDECEVRAFMEKSLKPRYLGGDEPFDGEVIVGFGLGDLERLLKERRDNGE